MRLKDIGEFGLIKRFQKKIRVNSSVVTGSGDDCAVLKFDKNIYEDTNELYTMESFT